MLITEFGRQNIRRWRENDCVLQSLSLSKTAGSSHPTSGIRRKIIDIKSIPHAHNIYFILTSLRSLRRAAIQKFIPNSKLHALTASSSGERLPPEPYTRPLTHHYLHIKTTSAKPVKNGQRVHTQSDWNLIYATDHHPANN
jgi:hypothetical protein